MSAGPTVTSSEVRVTADGARLAATLAVPRGAFGLVVFAHGSGSSRHSPRNRAVAAVLQRAGIATLLLDLLTEREESDRSLVFDVGLLADRLAAALHWAHGRRDLRPLPLGLFGASTGAGAALIAAARSDVDVAAVVSRGGRPDLAGDALAAVACPTLLIVGGADHPVLELNEHAAHRIGEHAEVLVVPGATHLFAEPGALDVVADAARDWFRTHLGDRSTDEDDDAADA
jgi:putative phosphoribosyl transferase